MRCLCNINGLSPINVRMTSWIIVFVFLCASACRCGLADKCMQKEYLKNFFTLSTDTYNNEYFKFVHKNINIRKDNGQDSRKSSTVDFKDDDIDDVILKISDEDYYAMPQMFQLDSYFYCVKRGGVFCLGNFDLSPIGDSTLFRIMKGVSANWVDFANHTRIYRGTCLTCSCSSFQSSSQEEWLESCVNAKMISDYKLTARLTSVDYCREGQTPSTPLSTNEKAFAVFIIVILTFTAISTVLDVKLAGASKKNHRWALSWSLYTSWKALVAPTRSSSTEDLRAFDGLRVFCMIFVIGAHVGISGLAYVDDTSFERYHHTLITMLLVNSTLVVQVFFLMSSFLMAHKLLRDKTQEAAVLTFFKTMLKRFIRLSPVYFLVVWFSMTWWSRVDEGPLWPVLVETEKVRCQQNWLLQFTYLDNSIDMHERCLVQGWYLSVDMQFYAVSLALTLLLRKSRSAIKILSTLLTGVIVAHLVIAYKWHITPNFVLHNYQSILQMYEGSTSMNMSYRSLLGNAGSPLIGLLLAYAHISRTPASLTSTLINNKVFRMCTALSLPAAFLFAWLSPAALGAGPPPRAPAAVFAAVERPVFVSLVAFAMFGAINGVNSPWSRVFSRAHAASRLTYGAYLLHLFFVVASVATKLTTTTYNLKTIFTESVGTSMWAYAASFLLTMLVELPTQTLYNEIKNLRIIPKLSDKK